MPLDQREARDIEASGLSAMLALVWQYGIMTSACTHTWSPYKVSASTDALTDDLSPSINSESVGSVWDKALGADAARWIIERLGLRS